MLTCFIKKKKNIFQILYIIVGPLCPASLKRSFSTVVIFQKNRDIIFLSYRPPLFDSNILTECAIFKCKVSFFQKTAGLKKKKVKHFDH